MGFRKSFGSVILAMAFSASTVIVTPSPAAALADDPQIGNQLALASLSLSQASMLPDLLPVIPGLEANAAMLLGLHEAFAGIPSEDIDGLASVAGSVNLETDINALTNADTGFTFEYIDDVESGGVHTIRFSLAANRTASVPLTVMEDDVQILGSNVDIDVTLPATVITIEYDDTAAIPGDGFALVDLPSFSMTASLNSTPSVPIQFGFAEATATGDFDVNFAVKLALIDPDGLDRITGTELMSLAIDDIIQLSFPDNLINDLDIDLTLTADVFGTSFSGQLTIVDENLFSGAPAVVTPSAGVAGEPIELLTNIGADTAITSLTQLISSYGAAMIAGDVNVPFLADGVLIPASLGVDDLADFDQVFDVIRPLMDYVTPRSSGQIVCGTDVGPDPDGVGPAQGIPTRPVRDLVSGQAVFCRAYTSANGSVAWTANGVPVGGASTTIGLEPTTNIELAANGSGELAIELAFTPDDGSGVVTIKPRPQTIQELLNELHDAGLIPDPSVLAGDLYDANLEAFKFPIGMNVTSLPPREARVNVGNSLVADTGLTGLSGDASATASYSIDNISAGITLGLIITEDDDDINPADNIDDEGNDVTGPGDRFFLSGIDSMLEVGDVTLDADLEMLGRLGFLEVGATVTGALTSPGTDPALKIGLTPVPGADGGVIVNGVQDADAILIRDLLSTELVGRVSASVNLEFDGAADVRALVPGLTATGGFGINWNLDNPKPTIGPFTGDFESAFLPFGGDQSIEQNGAPDADPTVLTTSTIDLLGQPGLVGSQLVDTDGNLCNITAVLSDTTLTCSIAGGTNPIAFADGASYDVKGNTLASLSNILAALDDLVVYLEGALGDENFAEPLPLVGISPADVVGQVGELRRMLDEFRGVQDAYITCVVNGDPDADIRGVPVGDSISCAAQASAEGVSNVTFQVTGQDPVAAPDGAVSPDANPAGVDAVSLTIPASLDVDAVGAVGHGFVALGNEYTVTVKWTDSVGEHQAAFPPRVPQGLRHLGELISETLGLPDGALVLSMDDTAAVPTVRIDMAYGICSRQEYEFNGSTQCATLPEGGGVEAALNLSLSDSGIPDFVGLDVVGTLDVDYAAIGQFNIGIPLTGETPVLYAGTGITANVGVMGSDDFGVNASFGPASAVLGAAATGGDGTAEATTDSDTLDATGTFADVNVGMVVTNTTVGSEGACVISAINSDDSVECDAGWAEGHTFTIGGRNDLEAGIAVDVQVTDEDPGTAKTGVLTGNESVAINHAGIDLPAFADLGGATCGPIDEDLVDRIVGVANDANERELAGFGCAQLSMAFDLGGTVTYLGELDVEIDTGGPDLRVWVPSTLSDDLLDAVLDPSLILQLLPDLLESIETQLRSTADSGLPTAVADPLRTGADGLELTRLAIDEFIVPFAAELKAFDAGEPIEDFIATELTDLLGIELPGTIEVNTVCGAVDCDEDDHDLLDITEVTANFAYTQEVTASAGINLGLDGLPLRVEAGASAFARITLEAGIGVSTADGPFLDLDGPEVTIEAGVELDDSGASGCLASTIPDATVADAYDENTCIRARLGFLEVEAIDSKDNPTEIAAELTLDLSVATDPDNKLTLPALLAGDLEFDADFTGNVNIDLHLRTGIADEDIDLPTILGTFSLTWGTLDDSVEVGFDNLHLDLGAALSTFLEPLTKEIKKITGPFQPIIDVVTAPIPVVSDLAELVGSDPITMLSILEGATGADLALVKAIAGFITFVNSIPSDGSLVIGLGSPSLTSPGGREPGAFKVDSEAAAGKVSTAEAGKLIDSNPLNGYTGGKGFTSDLGSAGSGTDLNTLPSSDTDRESTFGVPGLSFPFLQDAGQIFGLLVGRDATLIRWDAGTLKASAGLSYDFGPIMVGPIPITITIGGEIGIEGRFAIGYDTSGIRKLLDGGSGTALFDGIFIDDLDANGNDVPEITFFGRVFAGASVDLVIVSAGVRGGIELTFTLDLDDRPDPDGKLRIEEIVDKLANPICLFEVGGKIEAFLEAFVKIDLFFFSKEFSFELVRITLLEWSSACEPPAPDPASQDGEVLTLHIGSLATERNVQEGEIDESFEVRQLGPGKVRVTAFGFEEVATGVGLIVADGGIGEDEILFLPGSDDADADAEPIQFTIPVVVTGGPGNDVIKTGDADDLIFGDEPLTDGTWGPGAGIAYSAPASQDESDGDAGDGDDGNDVINAGEGSDVVKTNGGNDRVEGEGGRDTIEGGPGDDQLNGGPGGDAVLGQGGNDSVHGGPIPQPAPGDTASEIDDNDALSGGADVDTLSGDFGDDVMFGDDPLGTIMDADTDMRRLGYTSKPSLATWRGWCDTVAAGGDADVMVGNAGDDVMVGGAGGDQMDGDEGNDWVCGSDGADEVVGGEDDDELRGNGDNDKLEGNKGNDVIFGGGGNDIADGNDGNDDIFGDEGADILNGDDGNDIVVGDTGSDTTPAASHGLTAGVGGTTVVQAKVLALDLSVQRDSSTSGPIRVDCNPETAHLVTGDSDCIFGGSGSDALFGGSDGDIVQGQAGVDLIEGNHGDDNIRGGSDRDLLFGNEDDDTMYGDGDADAMYGDRSIPMWGTDTPEGAGVDLMFGGPGADHTEGDGDDDDMFGGAGNDHMEGNDGVDDMYGDSGDDDMIGGSDTAGEPDVGESIMVGGIGSDVMTGDNAIITPAPDGFVGGRTVTLLDPAIGGADVMQGNDETDFMFGQLANDTMSGGDAADYMEGNDGNDDMAGNAGGDDMIGGSSADDGLIVADRIGNGVDDLGETSMRGGDGEDWMAGDNARMNRVLVGPSGIVALRIDPIQLFDLAYVGGPAVPATAHGPDTMGGDGGTDFMFGQGSNDTMTGDDEPDYMEGNDGNDDMSGGDGNDDMVGGGSARNGEIVKMRDGEGLHDEGETLMTGDDGADWMAGDNALMNRVLFNDVDTPIDLFDVNSVDEATVSGGDAMQGNDGEDLMFGQGNGAQVDQSDPLDGVDNDGDGDTDEDGDAPGEWLGDIISGGPDDDYIEGNHGSDLITGDGGADDLIGGGSAFDGLFVPDRIGNGLEDERDTIYGDDGEDVITGDNARINRSAPVTGLLLTNDREVLLFDLVDPGVAFSGGDFLAGGAERDLMFGQGNGGQSADQADPLDGVDNDFSGREGPDSTEYDCGDNGFDNDGDGLADAADPDCFGAGVVDEDQLWDGDIMRGDAGDDYMEGNAGADWMFGGDDEDDMIGGGSANNGEITPTRNPEGLLDGPDVMHGDGEDDVMAGDNARINRVANNGTWDRLTMTPVPDFGPYDQTVRITDMFPGDAGPGAHADDYMTGNTGNDEMYGQLGDDFVLGNAGDDALVGDLGQVRANLLGDGVGVDPAQRVISTNSPHWEDTINEVGSMLWETQLYAFDTSAGGLGGNDVLLGYDGRDTAFGGPGADVINGDGDGTEEFFDALQPEYTHITDVDPATADQDMLFGGDGGDAIWGGRDNDILMGGHGDDFLDVRPREETDNGRNGGNFRIILRDPPSWFTWAYPENFQDVDFIYGGWDRDALQADQAENGPDAGDRLADWAGGFNVFYLCPAGYGDHTITRMGAPHARDFLRDLTQASGAFMTSASAESGFRDLGYVFPNQRGQNSHPPHPDHPGHFTCADFTGVGSGAASAAAGGPYVIEEGGSLALDGTGSTGEGGITSFAWDVAPFGIDDAASVTPTITADGLDDGIETVQLEIIDAEGGMSFADADVTIVNAVPVVTVDALPPSVADGELVALDASYDDPGVLDTHTVLIDWGDGTACDPDVGPDCSRAVVGSTGTITGSHAYGAPGDYGVTITVSDDDLGVGTSAPSTVSVGAAPVVGVRTAAVWAATEPWPLADPLTVGGVDYTRVAAIDVFDDGSNNERSSVLFRELTAMLLNQEAGTDTSCVAATLVNADTWLVANPPGSGVKKNDARWKNEAKAYFDTLTAYNVGSLCAPAP